ncbi:MAG: serine/threonine-protein kinase [Nannocystaceae bacterium]
MGEAPHASLPWRRTVLADTWQGRALAVSSGQTLNGCDDGVPVELAALTRYEIKEMVGAGAMGVVYRAIDTLLDRFVAVKILSTEHTVCTAEEVMEEARALAKVSHSNVVQVYDVVDAGGFVCIIMEYVAGTSLEALHERGVPWKESLRVLCAAGRGLAAVHSVGLVHRDFKPGNVLLSEEGAAKVADLGLAKRRNQETGVGTRYSVAGTPAYMSPEQHFGGVVGPHSDQFSFAITLYEALYGYRPFEGISWKEIREKVHRGDVPPPPPDVEVPRRLFKVILRGLAIDPEARWPSMAAMVEALERDPMRARLRVAGIVALIGAASLSSYALARSQGGAEEACKGAAAHIEPVWNAARREAVAASFTATGLAYAPEVWRRVEARLDDYATAWALGHQAACEVQAEATQSPHLSELRFLCLERRKALFAGVVDAFAHANPSIVENAVQAASSLPSISRCAEVELLLSTVEVPEDAAVAAEVEAVRSEIIRVSTDELVGRYAAGRELAEQVSEQAQTTRFGPVIAEAALARGSLLLAASIPEEAEVALREAIEAGIEYDLHALAAEAAAKWIFVVGDGLGQHAKALAAAPFARALVARSRDDGDLAALLHNNLGSVYDRQGDYETALAEYEASLAILEERGDEDEVLYGATQNNIGALYVDRRDYGAAEKHYAVAVECLATALSDGHPMVGAPLVGLGEVALARGDLEDSQRNFERARELFVRALGEENPTLVYPLSGLGRTAARRGEPEVAKDYFRETIALGERAEANAVEAAFALEGLADIERAAGDVVAARGFYERAVEVYRSTTGADTPLQAQALLQGAVLAAELGAVDDARAKLEQLVALPNDPESLRHSARGRLLLAYELAKEPDGSARACALVSAALPRLSEADAVAARELRESVCASDER